MLILEYSRITRSITTLLLMPWLPALTGHQELRYWICKINGSLYSIRKDFKTQTVHKYPIYMFFTHSFTSILIFNEQKSVGVVQWGKLTLAARQCECILSWASRKLSWASSISYRTCKGHLFSGECSRNLVSHTVVQWICYTIGHQMLMFLLFQVQVILLACD